MSMIKHFPTIILAIIYISIILVLFSKLFTSDNPEYKWLKRAHPVSNSSVLERRSLDPEVTSAKPVHIIVDKRAYPVSSSSVIEGESLDPEVAGLKPVHIMVDKDTCKRKPIPCLFNTSKLEVKCAPYYIDISNYDLSNFTFITGATSDHFEESKDLIASIQKHFPHKKLYYHDLGLKSSQVEQIKSFCNVVYVKWNPRDYPQHVWYIPYYAFKSLVIHQSIMRFDAVFWLDASGRVSRTAKPSDWQKVYDTARVTDGVVMFRGSTRDVFQCTHKGMYRYIPADQEKLKRFRMYGSGSVLLYRTQSIFEQIMSCWRLCGLTKECNEPKGHQKGCPNARQGVSICHRYDQSALNILIAKLLNYQRKHIPPEEQVIEIHRNPTKFYKLKTTCVNKSD